MLHGIRVVQVVSSGLAPYKLPRALVSLLIYQQPSSTTLYYSYQEHLFLTKARLRNETGEITDITLLPSQSVSFVLRLRQSFPEDCVRLKLSSARASQAGLREMMTRRRVKGLVTDSLRLGHNHRTYQKAPSWGLCLEPVACSCGLARFSLLLAYLAVSVLTATDVGGKSSG